MGHPLEGFVFSTEYKTLPILFTMHALTQEQCTLDSCNSTPYSVFNLYEDDVSKLVRDAVLCCNVVCNMD